MHPILLRLGPIQIHSYGLLVAIGVAAALYFIRRRATKYNLNPDAMIDLSLIVVVCSFVGARIFYVALYWDYFRTAPLEIIQIWKGGIVFYGGMVGGLVSVIIYAKRQGHSALRIFDLFLPAVAVGQGFGRLGCFFNGCCYGLPTGVPWAIQFPFLHSEVHPTQIYEAFYCFLLAGALFWMSGKKLRPGLVTLSYFGGYAVGRFAIEFFRGDNERVVANLTVAQIVSIIVVLLVGVVYSRMRGNGT